MFETENCHDDRALMFFGQPRTYLGHKSGCMGGYGSHAGYGMWGRKLGRNGAVAVAQGMILGVMMKVGYLFYGWRSLNE